MDHNGRPKVEAKYEAVEQSTQPSTPKRPTKNPRSCFQHYSWVNWLTTDPWTPQWLSLLISFAALICIIVILRLYDGAPLSSWSHTISLNTALSTLGTIMKGFMLLAVGASVGQVKWLWYAQRTHRLYDFQIFDQASRGPWGSLQLLFRINVLSLGSIAAVVTLLALASESFIQQSVSYPLQESEQTTMAASVPTTQDYLKVEHNTVGEGDYSTALSMGMMAAIYDGLLTSNLSETTSVLRPICPSGNCTFPVYVSLDVCSRCADVTAELNFTKDFGTGLVWTLPNNFSLEASTRASGKGCLLNMTSSFTPISYGFAQIGPESSNTIIYECTVFACVRSYTSSVRLHIFSEEITDVHEYPIWNFLELPNTPYLANDTLAQTFDLPGNALSGIAMQNRTLSLGVAARFALHQAFGAFQGEIDASYLAPVTSTSDIAQMFYQHTADPNAVSDVFNNIATALTNMMRKQGDAPISGTVFATETHIVMQWWWLSLPVVMVLLATIALGTTIWQTWRRDVPNWRSNELAILAYGVRAQTVLRLANYDSGNTVVSGLEAQAKATNVELQRLQTGRTTFCLRER